MSAAHPPAKSLPDFLSILVLIACCIVVFLLAPKHGLFSWSEAPRNALNGAFVMDLLVEHPFGDPKGWAYEYYYQYPALTILFYPPMLYAVLSVFYLLFGVSHAVAVACIVSFLAAFAIGIYSIVRRVAEPGVAAAAALFAISSYEIYVWGQQVMLEVPMLAFLVWGTYFLLQYGSSDRTRDLGISALLFLCALYTKQTAAIPLLGIVVGFVWHEGFGVFRRRPIYLVAALVAIALIPLVYLQLTFGSFNITSVVDRSDVAVNRASLEGIGWYAVRLPEMTNPLIAVGAAMLLALVAIVRTRRISSAESKMLLAWFVLSYLALTLIDLKETRHGIFLIPPVAIAAALLFAQLPRAWGGGVAMSAGLASFAWIAWAQPTPWVSGYHEAAEKVVAIAPRESRILFLGNRDGSFIFNVRQLDREKSLSIIRADKLFLDISIMPEHGLNPRAMGEAEMKRLFHDLGISYVVAVPDIWTETAVIRTFYRLLASDQFERVDSIPVAGRANEKRLDIYRNTGEIKSPPDKFTMKLSGVGVQLKGN